MPVKYVINEQYRVEFVTARGILTVDDIVNHRASITADPRFYPDFAQLADFTNLDTIQMSANEIERLSRPHMYAVNSRRVFLVGSDLQFGLARMFKTYGELNDGAQNLLISRTLGEASAWINVPVEVARAALLELCAEPEVV